MENKSVTYKDAGVDIDAGNRLVDMIKPMVKSTSRPEVLTEIGGFGGYSPSMPTNIKSPPWSRLPMAWEQNSNSHSIRTSMTR